MCDENCVNLEPLMKLAAEKDAQILQLEKPSKVTKRHTDGMIENFSSKKMLMLNQMRKIPTKNQK